MKTVIITGIDSSGKTTTISHLPWKNVIKYPNNEDIKNQINSFYQQFVTNHLMKQKNHLSSNGLKLTKQLQLLQYIGKI